MSFERVFHWGPLIAIGIIKCIVWSTIHCNSMWWPPFQSIGGFFNAAVFFIFSGLTLYNLLFSLHIGPGHLPLGWKPDNAVDCQYLQFCTVCQGYKAPRSHHCRKCGKCVLKMDHHCPWINNCVGHRNHTNFTLFLLSAVCGCLQASVIIIATLYRALNANYYYYHQGSEDVPLIVMGLWPFIFCLFSLGLAIGVVFAVGFLFYVQMKAIIRNRTGIEDWVLEKAAYRREETGETFIYPYDLGWKRNFLQVFNWSLQPKGDGICWDVRNDCNQYTFTIEQMEQKKIKRERSLEYEVHQNYSGRWFPLSYGLKVCLRFPCTDEPRIPLFQGDIVVVTRWKRYWIYGEVKQRNSCELTASDRRLLRGWFPRNCCVLSSPFELDKKDD